MEIIRRNISFKLRLNQTECEYLNQLLNDWGDATTHTFNHIKRVYDAYSKQDNPQTGQCLQCKAEDVPLRWQHKQSKSFICNKCFMMSWSMETLTKSDGYQKGLIDNFPELSVYKGYYAGVIKYAVPMFKSWLSKCDEREREIKQLQVRAQTETNPIRQRKILSKLNFKEKGIKELVFNKNVLYFGAAGMFEFKEDPHNQFWLGITNPKQKGPKLWFELTIGESTQYTSTTNHDKFKIIRQCIKNKEHRQLFGKILKREKYFEFMFPKREMSYSMTSRADIEKLIKQKPETNIISLSFGVKKPIAMVVFKDKIIVEKKIFGDAALWDRINHEREYRSKVMKVFGKRYQNKQWLKRKAIKRFYKKRGIKERQHIRHHTQKFTTNLIRYLIKTYHEGVIIMRDIKGIKRISYPTMYRTVLDRWNVAMQNTMLEYKEMLASFHVYKVPYKESNNLKCANCGKEFIENKKPIKVLTLKLLHGLSKERFLKQKANALKRKIWALQKYIPTTERLRWLQECGNELKIVTDKLRELNGNGHGNPNYGWIKCPHCNLQGSFDYHDSKMLCLPVRLQGTNKN